MIQTLSLVYDVRENKQRSQFYEDVTTRGMLPFFTGSMSATEALSHASALLEAEYVSDYDQPIYAFVERAQEDLLDYDYGMEQTILSMDPIIDEGPLPNNYIDLATGWDSVSKDRMNSIAFRGVDKEIIWLGMDSRAAPTFRSKVQTGEGAVFDRSSDLLLHLRANGINWTDLSTGSYQTTAYGNTSQTIDFNPRHDTTFKSLKFDGNMFFGVTGSRNKRKRQRKGN